MNGEDILKGLNDKQQEAVKCVNGPLLVLAGAGSGKTRVITHRIAYLIALGVRAWNILAITFTNKAAGEMRERVDRMLSSEQAGEVWVSTFHAMCLRLLRRDIDKLGYQRDFCVYDTDDQRTLMRGVIKSLNLDNKLYRDRGMLSLVSNLKNEMQSPREYEESVANFYDRNTAKIYLEYERELKANNALDFDDLLLKTVELFERFPDVLLHWQERFRYILIDEYQDTNNVQFNLVRLLSQKYKNLCVVGDDDQSIYKFRGANIENILGFEKTFSQAKVVKLEQNYRSTGAILNAANQVINNNSGRKQKKLWTKNEDGDLPAFWEYETASDEAKETIRKVSKMAHEGVPLKNQAVLYRTNAQSRLLEEQCVQANIPYVIVGGVNFYQRKEIKDVLSYLRVLVNVDDDLSSRRIINVPRRGIGQTSVYRLNSYASANGISFYQALEEAERVPGLGSAIKRVQGFTALMDKFRSMLLNDETDLAGLIEKLIYDTGYVDELKKDDQVTFETRLENIEELKGRASIFETERTASQTEPEQALNEGFEPLYDDSLDEENKMDLLSAFLEDVSLVSDIDRTVDTNDVLNLMTLHSAKGLEFDTVYISGMEEGLFPSSASINSDDPVSEIEEERRLCYVGMTRAKKSLILSSAKERMVNGELRYTKVSRFIDEINDELLDKHFINTLKKAGRNFSFDFEDDEDEDEESLHFEKKAYSAYNSFNRQVYGNYGSLDHSTTRKRYKPKEPGLIPGVSKGLASGPSLGYALKKLPDYTLGDRVEHLKFGVGTVEDITEAERDYKVTVNFDHFGTKVMYAAFARLKKC